MFFQSFKKSVLKVLAALFAAVVCIVSVGSITSSANKIYIYSGSEGYFNYEMRVQILGDKEIQLHVDFTNSLSISAYDFLLEYDSKCTLTDVSMSDGYTSCLYYYNANQTVSVSFICISKPVDKDFSLDFTFNTSDSACNPHSFTAAITSLGSLSGSYYDFDNSAHTATTGDCYTIGDVDNNGSINAVDASYVLQFLNLYGNVDRITAENHLSDYQKICPALVSMYATDANWDGIINNDDSTAILQYSASYNTSLTEDDIIGTKYCVTVNE